MATFLARYQAIGNALIDGVATAQQLSAVADAYVAELSNEEIAEAFPGATRATLTDAQRAAIAVIGIKTQVQNTWRTYNIRTKQNTTPSDALPL